MAVSINVSCQVHMLDFSVECCKNLVPAKGGDREFILSIRNNGLKEIKIPTHYIVGQRNSIGSEIEYDVFYCGKSDTSSVISGIQQIEHNSIEDEMITLMPHERFLLSAIIPFDLYFIKKGTYKVVFYLKPSKSNEHIGDELSTNSFYLFLK